jgi:hypothetical protein
MEDWHVLCLKMVDQSIDIGNNLSQAMSPLRLAEEELLHVDDKKR